MSRTTYSYQPPELVPPGETLEEWLQQADMTQAEFAKRTSLTPKHINHVVKGGATISPEVALAFERVTAIPAPYWLRLEANFQTAKQRVADTEALSSEAGLVDLFPYKAMQRRGIVPPAATKVDRLRELLGFFGVADAKALRTVAFEPAMFRLSEAFDADDGALAAWLRVSELEASEIDTAPYDASRCRAAIPAMRQLSTLPDVEWVEPLQDLAASVGIALVIVQELPGCRVNGATRWLSPDKAMIALSLRHRRNDIFWFTLFHELCHVLRHSKKQTFIDNGASADIAAELEDEANQFAARTLIPPELAARIAQLRTAAQVKQFASDIGVAPGVVVGRMRHEGLIPHKQWAGLIETYRFQNEL